MIELPSDLDLSQGDNLFAAFYGCTALNTIGSGLLLGTAANTANFNYAFWGCSSLVDFPAGAFDTIGTPDASCFVFTWDNCTALSATSVFNILSSIDTSGQSAPSTGPQITIDYDGTTLSAATNTAIASLRDTKGWSIFINGAEQTA